MVFSGIAEHHTRRRSTNDEWITPLPVLQALGPFDLDPCAAAVRPWDCARENWHSDGLLRPWHGNVWCNPPYGEVGRWLGRLAQHGNGIALTFARTETRWFFDTIWNRADAVLFLRSPRLLFHYPDGTRAKHNCGAPSVLVAYGNEMCGRLRNCGLAGKWIDFRGER
jgi:hypothetical protein